MPYEQVAETLYAAVDIAAEHDALGTAAILDELIGTLAARAEKIIFKQNLSTPLALKQPAAGLTQLSVAEEPSHVVRHQRHLLVGSDPMLFKTISPGTRVEAAVFSSD